MISIKILFLVSSLMILSGFNVFAQETDTEKEKAPEYGWKNQVISNLNLTQNSFDNWTQGGENSLSWQLNIDAKFVQDEADFNWSNTGKFVFGETKVGDSASRKSVDEILLETVYTRKLGLFVDPYGAFSAQSQFGKGYDYSVEPKLATSNFLDPGYFRLSLGIGRAVGETFKSRLGFAVRYTVTDKYNQYADDPKTAKIEDTRTESGLESVTEIAYPVAENMLFKSNLNLFSNLEQFRQVVVRWDNIISAKVNEYISANFNFQLYYDHNISKQRQVKQALSLGLTYTLL